MSKVPGLTRRGNRYYFRRRVPKELQAIIGKTEITRSLGDVSFTEAKRLANLAMVETDRKFELAGKPNQSAIEPIALTVELINEIVQRHFRLIESFKDELVYDDAERNDLIEAEEEYIVGIQQSLNDQTLQSTAIRAAENLGYVISPQNKNAFEYFQAYRDAELEHARRRRDRLMNKKAEVRDARFDLVQSNATLPETTVREAIEKFMTAAENQDLSAKTKAAWNTKLSFMQRYFGADTKLSSIDRAQMRAAQDVLLKLPPNFQKTDPDGDLTEIAERNESAQSSKLAPQTAERYVHGMSTLFRWSVREELVSRNPAEGLKGPKANSERARRSFSTEELNQLFSASVFDKNEDDGTYFWMLAIGLFSGMRFNEIAGIKGSDIVEIDGNWFFDVRRNEIRGLKNSNAKRLVPIHPNLIKAGILELAKERKGSLLLKNTGNTRSGNFNGFQKRIGRRVRREFSDSRLVFHSLRHSFRDGLRHNNIDREVAAKVGGWKIEGASVMDSYGDGHTPTQLFNEIEKLKFDGIGDDWG